jgi:hypothetical protein
MAKSDLLAVAFTDMNGNHKYNPGKDTLIASLVDTNRDGVASVGDTVHWGTYPAIPDGRASGIGGQYLSPDLTVTNVLNATSTEVRVETAIGVVYWSATPNVELFFALAAGNGLPESFLLDSINIPGDLDQILTDPALDGPGNPNFPVDTSAFQLGNQGFLDIFIGVT